LRGNLANSSFKSKKQLIVSEPRVLQVRFMKKTLRKSREFTSGKGRVRRMKEGEEEKGLFSIF
jgi:hypothetical protein